MLQASLCFHAHAASQPETATTMATQATKALTELRALRESTSAALTATATALRTPDRALLTVALGLVDDALKITKAVLALER